MTEEEIVISGIPIEVLRKPIKNMHLAVKPPDGKVVVSAPEEINKKAIETFVRLNIAWVRHQQTAFEEQPRFSKRQYVSGETLYIWGKQYFLSFVPNEHQNSFILQGMKVILSMRKESTVQQRENYVREQYRNMLKEKAEKLFPKWEQLTGLYAADWHTKYMTTRWGTCVPAKKRIWLNVQLAEKPEHCLDYVILHELVHFKDKTHGPLFISLMDTYMPEWRSVQKTLNDAVLDFYKK